MLWDKNKKTLSKQVFYFETNLKHFKIESKIDGINKKNTDLFCHLINVDQEILNHNCDYTNKMTLKLNFYQMKLNGSGNINN